MIALDDSILGLPLRDASALYADNDQFTHQAKEGILLSIGQRQILLNAINDTSELLASIVDSTDDCLSGYQIVDINSVEPIAQCIGKSLREYWRCQNSRGYDDGCVLAFDERFGFCFVVMNNHISILAVQGEQLS